MSIEGWITLVVLVVVVVMLAVARRATDMIVWGGVGLLLLVPVPAGQGAWKLGVLTPPEAFGGLANEGVITIAALFVVAAALRETGGMDRIAQRLLGRPRTVAAAQRRIMWPAAAMSAFLNNTPLVAMLLPTIAEWAKKNDLSLSKLLIPLSYASILGGACTLIGTSTTLIVNGWLIESGAHPGLGMFEPAWVGVPCAVAGILFVLASGRWLLPDRKPVLGRMEDAREYTVSMLVKPRSPLAGKTIEAAGLRHLPGLFLIEIQREDQVLPAVSSKVTLLGNDRLVFAGILESVVDLQKMRGLAPATSQVGKLSDPRTNRRLVEAVVSNTCPLVGRTIRDGKFRTVYNAAVIAVARSGARLRQRIGDVVLHAGDTLLLEARASFAEQQRNSRDFYLVSKVEGSRPLRYDRAWIGGLILAGLVVTVASGVLSMLQAAITAAALMILTRCCTAAVARRAVDWQVLLVIAAALGLGEALRKTGLAAVLAGSVMQVVGNRPLAATAAVFGLTVILASVITAKAAAVLMLPIALGIRDSLSVAAGCEISFTPFAMAVLIASATTLATPIGYPTNMMVYGPGGYRFSDYMRVGLPLTALVCLVSMLVIPLVWPFGV